MLERWHGTFLEDAKTLRAASVLGLNLASGGNSVQLRYKTDPAAASDTEFGADFAATPQQRAAFPDNTSAYIADLQVVLKSTSPSSSPQVTGFGLHHAVRPALVLEYAGAVLAADGLLKRDGRPMRLGAAAMRQAVKDAASAQGSVTVILPDEDSKQLSFVDYGETLAWGERARRWQAAVSWKAVELRTNTTYGSVARLGAYTVGDLSGTSVSQLGGI